MYVEILELTGHAVLSTTTEVTQDQGRKMRIGVRVSHPLLEIRYALIVEFAPSWMIAQEDMQSCLIRVAAAWTSRRFFPFRNNILKMFHAAAASNNFRVENAIHLCPL